MFDVSTGCSVFVFVLCQHVASAVGTFGRVLECWDRQEHEFVAIKIVRSVRKYRDAAKAEVNVLQLLAKNDRGNTQCVNRKY